MANNSMGKCAYERGPSLLYRALPLGSVTLRNRLALAPATRAMASPEGVPTVEMAAYYRRYAGFGVGLIITEGTYVDERAAAAYVSQPGMATPLQLDGWKRVVGAVKNKQAAIFLQLQHSGPFREPRLGPGVGPTDRLPAVPSWQYQERYLQNDAIARGTLAQYVEAFARSAALAKEAGFDGVEIHGARGYLLDAFLSGSNDRDDEFGGTLENRLRLPTAVVRAVREQIGSLVLSYNLSLYKMDNVSYRPPGGAEEVAQIVDGLAQAGVDVFHASTRGFNRCVVDGVPYVNQIRRSTDRIVIGGGGIKSVADAEAALGDGQCDIVSMARALIANPNLLELGGLEPRRYERGMERNPVAVDW